MDPKTVQRAPLKPKGCCASPSSPHCCATAQLGVLPGQDTAEGRAMRMQLHPKLLSASSPSCARLSPLLDEVLWPLTACQAPQGRPALTARFPRLPGRLTALPRRGTNSLWRLFSWQGAASRARSLPRGSRRNRRPGSCRGQAGTPRLRTMGREGRGCRWDSLPNPASSK